eukprot:3207945-Rhodomonas_salina.1
MFLQKKKIDATSDRIFQFYLLVRYKFSGDGQRLLAFMPAYIEKVAVAHGVDPNLKKGPKTPMSEKFEVKPEDILKEEDVDQVLRQKTKSLVGSLIFPVGWCRLDCAVSVATVARHEHNPSQMINDAALRILKFMVVSKTRGIRFSAHERDYFGYARNQLWAAVDSSWADDNVMCKSTSGYIVFLNGARIAYRVKLSPTVIRSTGHAEYVAANFCCEDVCHFRDILDRMGFAQNGPTPIHEDNETCIAIAKGTSSTGNKFIDIHYHYLRDQQRLMNVILVPTKTSEQKADVLTKNLGPTKFWRDTSELMSFEEDFKLD